MTALFSPFRFTSRSVPTATNTFDFEQWKRQPSRPIILKKQLVDWPLFQKLQKCGTDEARVDYLSSTFGSCVVGYTTVPASDPFMGYDENGNQNFQYAPANCTLSEFCTLIRNAMRNP